MSEALADNIMADQLTSKVKNILARIDHKNLTFEIQIKQRMFAEELGFQSKFNLLTQKSRSLQN